jgi:tetratricopeptide (TPR) repeat protein
MRSRLRSNAGAGPRDCRGPADGEPETGPQDVVGRAAGFLFALVLAVYLAHALYYRGLIDDAFISSRTLLWVLSRNQPDAALAELRAALSLTPDSALAHYHLAAALDRTGQHAENQAHLGRARSLDPGVGALPATPEGTPPGRDAFPWSRADTTQQMGSTSMGRTR